MNTLINHRPATVPMTRACSWLSLNRSSIYAQRDRCNKPQIKRCKAIQPRALSDTEQRHVLAILNSDEFCDQPPFQVYQTLLDRGEYYCSVSTMHRLLRKQGQSGERRQQRAAQSHAVPRLAATQPNEVWTWDCSKLRTYRTGVYLTLYVVLDLYSRYVLAWMVSRKENSALAKQLMREAIVRYRIDPGQLTLHQDRGAPMIAHRFLNLLNELGVTPSHSRPRVSNDNPFSEAQFKTLKYQPDYPGRFNHQAHAVHWHDEYFDWYNNSHHHSMLAGFTPEQVFTGRYQKLADQKQQALDDTYQLHPERFVKGCPTVALPPEKVVINPVTEEERAKGIADTVNFPTLRRVVEKSTLTLN